MMAEQKDKPNYLEDLQRLQAEFENYKKRTEKEHEQLKDHAKAQLLLKIVSIHEDLERASTQDKGLKEAVQMISGHMKKLLEEEKVQKMETQGQKLDPYRHEAMLQEEGEDDDTITEELQAGYLFKDKVLKPARVKISKRKEE